MKALPQHKTLIQLSQGDICAAIEYWLNELILKVPCEVSGVRELQVMEGGRFEIIFDRPDNQKDSMDGEPMNILDQPV